MFSFAGRGPGEPGQALGPVAIGQRDGLPVQGHPLVLPQAATALAASPLARLLVGWPVPAEPRGLAIGKPLS